MSDTLLWITRNDGTVTGPHGIAYLRRELDQGNLTLDTLAAQEGTEDWMPLETWGLELYPKEVTRRVPYARMLAEPEKTDHHLSPITVAVVLLGFAGIVYFAIFYDAGVDTEFGRVSNLGRMNDRVVGLIASVAFTGIAILVEATRRRGR